MKIDNLNKEELLELKNNIDILLSTLEVDMINSNQVLPHTLLLDIIEKQRTKELKSNIWDNSPYKNLIHLQSNNVGIVGEQFMQSLCDSSNIPASIDGTTTKKLGGGAGDGTIKNSTPEIKLAHQGSTSNTFQHELGETPWKANYLIFIDVSPKCVYLTILKNFTEEHYKSGKKCEPYFPTKQVTWRKKAGAFKLDTSVTINEKNVELGHAIKIDETTNFDTIGEFINRIID